MTKDLEDRILEKTKELIGLIEYAENSKGRFDHSISINEFDHTIHIDTERINLVLDK